MAALAASAAEEKRQLEEQAAARVRELEDKLASMQASIVSEMEAKSQLLEQQQREMQAAHESELALMRREEQQREVQAAHAAELE
eukprot:COSAG04_NODE_31806_length_254_cov_78.741935_1_plen_84_part_11